MFESLLALIVALISIIIYLFSAVFDPTEKSGGLTSDTDTSPYQCRVLSFNIEYEATNYSPDDVVAVIKNSGADAAILNEAHEVEKLQEYHLPSTVITSAIARSGMNYVFTHDWAVIASRHPMQQPFKGSRNKYLDSATLIDGTYYVIPVHFTDYPYQPFQLAKIPYCYDTCQKNICSVTSENESSVPSENASSVPYEKSSTKVHPADKKCTDDRRERETISHAKKARGKDVDLLVAAINVLRQKYAAESRQNQPPIIIAGDFNEPSHLDWTEDVVAAGRKPLKVQFPTSKRLAAEGMIDLYRKIYPDPVKDPGYTWPARPMSLEELAEISKGTIKEQIDTPSDRIDFIYGYGVNPVRAEILETPSDHRAILIDIVI